MLVVSVVGISKSGKTTTIEYLTSKLTEEGYKVGSIKHIHHQDFSIDTEGTDTWRHMHAGAKVTVALAPKETVIIKKTDNIPSDLDDVIKLFKNENLDVIFVEGLHSLTAKRKDIPKIVTAKNDQDLMKTLEGTEPVLAVTGVITKKKTEIGKISVPLIDLNNEGTTLLNLVKNQIDSKKSSGA
ncbi:molybdopterin-guanine dinucleotide biosynthesis protein B [Candidatus Bathyarchaeota archaeon]|nr:molybdopterin-guanine dinucleotide biosynthesis protein B [Candidatus Bathyarchaeota archaeon]